MSKAKPTHEFRRLFSELGRHAVLTPLIEQALLDKGSKAWPQKWDVVVDNSERSWDGRFHPSSDAAAPELLLYYKFHPDYRLPYEPITVEDVLTFQVGNVYHSLIQSLLIANGLTTLDEVEVPFGSDAHNCSGTLDVRKVFLPDGTTPPVEIKSAGYLPKEPPPYYIQQFQVYMDLGNPEGPQEKGLMLFVEKQHPHRLREFTLTRDEAVLDYVYRKWRRVLEAIDLNQPEILTECCHTDARQFIKCPARRICRIGAAHG